MKIISIILLLIGIIVLYFGFNIDTTVATSRDIYSDRVHNIGLMNEKQNIIIIGIAILIMGAIFFSRTGFTKKKKCSFCFELINSEAKVCRYCHNNVIEKQTDFSIPDMIKAPIIYRLYKYLLLAISKTNGLIYTKNEKVTHIIAKIATGIISGHIVGQNVWFLVYRYNRYIFPQEEFIFSTRTSYKICFLTLLALATIKCSASISIKRVMMPTILAIFIGGIARWYIWGDEFEFSHLILMY